MTERAQFGAQVLDLCRQLRRPRDARQHAAKMRQVDRLQQVVGRTVAHRLDRAFERGVTGDDDDLCFAFARRRIAQQLEAVAVGQDQVEQNDVGRRRQKVACALQRIGAGGREAVVGDELGQRFGSVRVVVDDQGVRQCDGSSKCVTAIAQGAYRWPWQAHVHESARLTEVSRAGGRGSRNYYLPQMKFARRTWALRALIA